MFHRPFCFPFSLLFVFGFLLSPLPMWCQSFQWPVDNPLVSQVYGCRDCLDSGVSDRYLGGISCHSGVDVRPVGASSSNYSTPVLACAAGVVEKIVTWPSSHGLGNTVIIGHNNGWYSLYGHLDSIGAGLSVGTPVARGAQIGVMGNSSTSAARDTSFGTHVHFEIKDSPTLGNESDDGPYWGYTPGHPDLYGYHDPRFLIDGISVESIGPVAVLNPPPGSLSVRESPGSTYHGSTSTAVIASIGEDQRMVAFKRVLIGQTFWYYIHLASRNDVYNGPDAGWISGSVAVHDPNATRVRVRNTSGQAINVRPGAGTGTGDPIAKVFEDQQFVTTGSPTAGAGCSGLWREVYVNGVGDDPVSEGWICSDFLEVLGGGVGSTNTPTITRTPTRTTTPVNPVPTDTPAGTPTRTFTPLPQGGLVISPIEDYLVEGPQGGPFSPSKTYQGTNTSSQWIDWSFSHDVPWINPDVSYSSTSPGYSNDVVVSVGNASSLTPGVYEGHLFFTNTTNHVGDLTLRVILTVYSQPTPTDTPISTPTYTMSPTPTITYTLSPSPTHTATRTPTRTGTPTLSPTPPSVLSDINKDGVVDAKDLLILLMDWGKESPGGVVGG